MKFRRGWLLRLCSDKCYLFDCSREPPPLSDDAEPEPEPEEDNP
eukprot:COSAG06_NODE_321_length_17580_cov_10.920313_5_plen_44_part_00